MDKNYQPKSIESKWYEAWELSGDFKTGNANVANYTIMLPPPNVTGTLHMGHGFQQTLMDLLIRYHRMMGDDTLWQVGTDHAGIATQMVVERQLAQENKSRHDLGRDAFIEKIWHWKEQSGDQISKQMKRLGASADWSRERFTMDEGLSNAVKEVFIRLYEEGIIYRGKRLVNWDPKFLTAISDLEVISEEEEGFLWHIRYPLVDSQGYLTVATTRPETMLGDMAIAVHPEDERYQHLIGQEVELPLCDRTIPIIADEYVDKEFGTGCVKITPAHDFNDYEVGMRHELTLLNILTKDAKINTNAPKVYQGLGRFEARKQIIADLEAIALLEKVQPHALKVPRGDRSGEIIEPFLTDQWFMKMDQLAKPAIDVVKTEKVKFVPKNWENTYFEWLNNIQDWCISRQLWWGHQIPAWYDTQGNVYVGTSEVEVREKYRIQADEPLVQDEDVLDTWFSSALWPFSTLGWPNKTDALQKHYPTNVLVSGFDIIFFWIARMVMMGLKFMDDVPFDTVYITGLIRDSEGKKMSKSKGNVLDPVDLIDGIDLDSLIKKRTFGMMQPQLKAKVEKATRREFPEGIQAYGTDALRFTYTALASTSRDINFNINRMEGYRNFCNKLWNAARFVMMNVENQAIAQGDSSMKLAIAERWIWHQFNEVVAQSHRHIAQYRFDLLAQVLYEFIWNQYCDWYVELAKASLNSHTITDKDKEVIRYTLVHILEQSLRLLHPVIPFITEEIWQQFKPLTAISDGNLIKQKYPLYSNELIDKDADKVIDWLKNVVVEIRTIRAQMNVKPSKHVALILRNASEIDKAYAEINDYLIRSLAKVDQVNIVEVDQEIEASASSVIGQLEIHIPLAGLIDIEKETNRLMNERDKVLKELARLNGKLSNKNFVANAPEAVVEKEKEKLKLAQIKQESIDHQLEKLTSLA
ncbi:valine--tRNA ligase [Thiotrichales bacterium 19S3-7]|nr:valine--tRNA ligase [Thiotrichales bacterium 19S3-7]MCF6801766.1 valine--tRNA ligase [Thiotrichales bacterium 19S3-11]